MFKTQQDLIHNRGMGYTLNDLITASGMEDCSPRDAACVMRNAQRDNAAVDQWMTVMKDSNTANLPTPTFNVLIDNSAAALANFLNNGPQTQVVSQLGSNAPVTVAQLEAKYSPQAAATRNGSAKITFTASRGNNSYQVGDTWGVKISGASPGAVVSVYQNGMGTSTLGTADSGGNWSLTGTYTSGDVGTWGEAWYLDGAKIGDWNFVVNNTTVSPVVAAINPTANPQVTNTTNTNSGSTNNTSSTVTDLTNGITSLIPDGIPSWAVYGGVAVVAFLMLKGR